MNTSKVTYGVLLALLLNLATPAQAGWLSDLFASKGAKVTLAVGAMAAVVSLGYLVGKNWNRKTIEKKFAKVEIVMLGSKVTQPDEIQLCPEDSQTPFSAYLADPKRKAVTLRIDRSKLPVTEDFEETVSDADVNNKRRTAATTVATEEATVETETEEQRKARMYELHEKQAPDAAVARVTMARWGGIAGEFNAKLKAGTAGKGLAAAQANKAA